MNEQVFPVLSANTLFHFTPSLDNLINILTDEFRPHYCLEDLNVVLQKKMSLVATDWKSEYRWYRSVTFLFPRLDITCQFMVTME